MTTVDALKFLNSSPKSRIRDSHCLLSWSSFCPVMFICILFAILIMLHIYQEEKHVCKIFTLIVVPSQILLLGNRENGCFSADAFVGNLNTKSEKFVGL